MPQAQALYEDHVQHPAIKLPGARCAWHIHLVPLTQVQTAVNTLSNSQAALDHHSAGQIPQVTRQIFPVYQILEYILFATRSSTWGLPSLITIQIFKGLIPECYQEPRYYLRWGAQPASYMVREQILNLRQSCVRNMNDKPP